MFKKKKVNLTFDLINKIMSKEGIVLNFLEYPNILQKKRRKIREHMLEQKRKAMEKELEESLILAKDMGLHVVAIEDGMIDYGDVQVSVRNEDNIPDFTFSDEACIEFKTEEVDQEATTLQHLEAATTLSFVTTSTGKTVKF